MLIGLSIADLYMHIPLVGRIVKSHRQWFFIGAYVPLALGVMARGL